MRKLLLSLSMASASSAALPNASAQYLSAIEGVWVGKLSSEFVNANGKADEPSTDVILIAVCGASAVLWTGTKKEDEFRRNSPVLPVRSLLNMHKIELFHLDDEEPPMWAEQQTYTLIAHSTNQAKLQWSRAVTNPLAAPDWPRRHFMGYGIADMTRTEFECNPQLGK